MILSIMYINRNEIFIAKNFDYIAQMIYYFREAVFTAFEFSCKTRCTGQLKCISI